MQVAQPAFRYSLPHGTVMYREDMGDVHQPDGNVVANLVVL